MSNPPMKQKKLKKNKAEEGWGDDNGEEELENDDLEDIQPEWGNAVEDEILDPEDDKKK